MTEIAAKLPPTCRLSAREIATRIAEGSLSAVSVAEEHLTWIAATEPSLKAFITVTHDEAIAAAAAIDAGSNDADRRLLGVPFAVKDLTATAAVRTTSGSLLFLDFVPAADELCVARLKAAGAVLIGKTNTPEFGFGARCHNSLQGPTANPHDMRLSSGGSSGGSAAAVVSGQASIAQGTDFGGSVRTPAGFCGAVAIRPTPGVIPSPGRPLARDTLATHGVIARDVDDAALMLAVMMGPAPADPSSLLPTPELTKKLDAKSLRIAASLDFGVSPMARDMAEAFERAVDVINAHFPCLRWAQPDCTGAKHTFETLRAATILHNLRPLLGDKRLSSTARWNARRGQEVTAEQFLEAEAARSALMRRFVTFFEEFDVLVTPSASVMPFPNTIDEIQEIDGRPLDNILDYLAITYVVSLVGFPALVLPAWMGPAHLPIGIQLVAPPLKEGRLIAVARMLEEAGFRHRFPGNIGALRE